VATCEGRSSHSLTFFPPPGRAPDLGGRSMSLEPGEAVLDVPVLFPPPFFSEAPFVLEHRTSTFLPFSSVRASHCPQTRWVLPLVKENWTFFFLRDVPFVAYPRLFFSDRVDLLPAPPLISPRIRPPSPFGCRSVHNRDPPRLIASLSAVAPVFFVASDDLQNSIANSQGGFPPCSFKGKTASPWRSGLPSGFRSP